jgi:hypothetical protein
METLPEGFIYDENLTKDQNTLIRNFHKMSIMVVLYGTSPAARNNLIAGCLCVLENALTHEIQHRHMNKDAQLLESVDLITTVRDCLLTNVQESLSANELICHRFGQGIAKAQGTTH